MKRFFSAVLLVLGLCGERSHAAPPVSRADLDLDALAEIEQRTQASAPRPPAESATKIRGNGVWEEQTLQVVRYRLLQRIITTMRTPDPAVVRYWVSRAAERDGAFTTGAVAVIKTVAPLAHWAPDLQSASDALAAEAIKAERISSGYFSLNDEENAALKRTLDFPSKRRALAGVVRGLLTEAGDLNPEQNETYQPIYRFLKTNIDESWKASRDDRAQKLAVAAELAKVFFDATNLPGLTANYERLAQLDRHLRELEIEVLDHVLKPGQTPMACCANAATQKYADTLLTFDRELVQALDEPAAKASAGSARVMDGLFPVWRSLDRYHAYLQYGRRTYALDILIEAARIVLMSASWRPEQEFDPTTGAAIDETTVQRAGHTIDLLKESQQSGAPGLLYAAVAIDEHGSRAPAPYAWASWSWLTAAEVDDLKLDKRVVTSGETRWILPAGARVKTIAGPEQAHAADAEELVLTVDPTRLCPAEAERAP